MRAIIVDDEPLARDGLRLLLADHADVELVGEAGNGADALALVERLRPDLLFVDVQMPEMTGLDVATRVGKDASGPAIVFVTAYDRFALHAFDVHALDYVLKPIDEQRFAEAIRRARVQSRTRVHEALSAIRTPAKIAIRDGEAIVLVPVDEIDWIEAADYYVEIHAGPRTYLHRETMQRLQTMLDPERFVRIHRSRLVNRERVREIRSEGRGELVVVTTSGAALKVARSCRAKLHALLP
ncbi:MAG: response regulator transcription factor [Deltaproteobacteria bacterium]|nr:response regulator transcription factor [Deltaproteobacteria bacterium]MCW5801990.1 response regulator transcription factor [Deltaproteobacteria bacterium]